jgi:hypothetical protein
LIRYDDHAEFQIARRRLDKAWIAETLAAPETVEMAGRRRSALKCLRGRRVMLRVVTPIDDPEFVITAYFDRTKQCA